MILLKNVPLHCLHENNSFNFPKNIYIANKINCRLGRDEKHLLVKDCFACIKPCISAGLRFLIVMYPSDYCTSRILPVCLHWVDRFSLEAWRVCLLVFLGVDRSWRNGSDFIFLGRRWNPFSTFSCSSMPQPLYSSGLSFLWKQGFNARICLVGRWCLVADGFCVGRCEICMWPRTIFMRTQPFFFFARK